LSITSLKSGHARGRRQAHLEKEGTIMKAQNVRNMEVASYLSDIEEEFSPDRLRGYTAEVTPHLPKSVRDDIEEACRQLVKAKHQIHKAVERLSH
jgi:hypothetical protein